MGAVEGVGPVEETGPRITVMGAVEDLGPVKKIGAKINVPVGASATPAVAWATPFTQVVQVYWTMDGLGNGAPAILLESYFTDTMNCWPTIVALAVIEAGPFPKSFPVARMVLPLAWYKLIWP
jgi:hypothetical protein